ncbi:two-component system sensor histidine kinase NtrB [Cucumibacter marinus]|uniref:two-component system sensor histidine kinase NtrB n=1 Tax=Cucumibacter marinus TaxID=1121252 RepID=UPI000427F762|nr:ATP-binding protein [Cucumibacter marinus]
MSDTNHTQIAAAAMRALAQPVLVCDDNLSIVYANYAAESFFKTSATVLQRQSLTDHIPFDSPLISLVTRVFERGAPASEYRVSLGTIRIGEDRVADLYASPFAEGEPLVAVLIQERTIADTIDRQLVSRGAARSVIGLAGMLAHEIKNPLSGIRGAAQLLEQSAGEDDRELARLVRDEADRIVSLVDRMEKFGDDRPLEAEPLNIHSVLSRVKLLAQNGVARGIDIVEHYDPSLPPVMGDRDQLIQVFLNLVKNAAEAFGNREKATITISTAFRPGIRIQVPGVAERVSLPLEIVVEDNGPGVPQDVLPHLFEPFVTTKTTGSGLGLALVAKFVGNHGGVIDCASHPGHTRFRVLLPLAADSRAPEQRPVEEEA